MYKNLSKNNQKAFTLIELLVVIGVLTILLSIVLVAINPARQFAQANNTQRRSDVNAILNAVHQYAADNNGDIGALGLTGTSTEVADTGADICQYIAPLYIAEMPLDPTDGTGDPTCAAAYATGYFISSTTGPSSRITVTAPSAELSETISITR